MSIKHFISQQKGRSMNKQLLIFSLVAGFAAFNVLSEAPCYSDYESKKQRWDEMAREVDTWTDGLGMPIDEKIRDTIIVLNLLGLKTQQSCEGHLDHGRFYPWISFDMEDAELELLINQAREISIKAEKSEQATIARHPELTVRDALLLEESELAPLWQTRNAAWDKVEQSRKMKVVLLHDLLMAFYKDGANPDTMITHEHIYDIASAGGYWQSIRDDATKTAKLKEYQDEMRRFTEFMIDTYYSK
jgi:hypothetical protein